MIDETCLRGNRPLSLRPERCRVGLPSDAKLMDQSNDVQPKQNSHEASDDLSIAGRKLRRLEHPGCRCGGLRARRLPRGLRRSRRRRGRWSSSGPTRCRGYAAAGRCRSPQGVLIAMLLHYFKRGAAERVFTVEFVGLRHRLTRGSLWCQIAQIAVRP
jgi:hypothetical protein